LRENISRRLDHYEWSQKQRAGRAGWFRLAALGAVAAIAVVIWSNGRQPSSGVGASVVPTTRNNAKLEIRNINGETRVQMRPSEETTVTVYQGGSDYSTLPPRDAVPSRSDKVAALSAYDVPLQLASPNPDVVWVRCSNGEVAAVFFPSVMGPADTEVQGTIVEALRAIANRHGVTIVAHLESAGVSQLRDVSGSTYAVSIGKALRDTKLTFADNSGFVTIR
jgi:hypothetical protein